MKAAYNPFIKIRFTYPIHKKQDVKLSSSLCLTDFAARFTDWSDLVRKLNQSLLTQ